MNYFKILFTAFLIFLFQQHFCQNTLSKSDDSERISLSAVVPDQIEGLSGSTKNYLKNKLNQIATKNGMGGAVNQRFILTANIQVLSKDITSTAPPMHAYTLESTFYIGDGIDGTLFSSKTITAKGVGQNKTKAYRAALKNIRPTNEEFKSFVNEGKNKIIEYYNAQCDFILKEAELLASQNNFDASIAKLSSVPKVCKECYESCMNFAAEVYQDYLDRECKISMNKAKSIWSSTQNEEGAKEASEVLSTIDPDSECSKDANYMLNMLFDEMKKRIKELDKRQWDYKLKEQQQESQRIDAIKQVGVAYGKNQPQNVTYNYRGWF